MLTVVGRFISFSDGMDLFISQTLKYVLLGLSLLAVSLSFTKSEPNNGVPSPLDRRSESHPRNAAQMQFPKNDMLIGLQDPFFWFLAPLFAMIAVGITVVLNYMIMATLYAVTKIYTVIDNLSKKDPKPTGNTLFSANSPRRRIIGTSFLLLFVATIVPYQFAYLVACIIQLLTCIRALKCAKDNVCRSSAV